MARALRELLHAFVVTAIAIAVIQGAGPRLELIGFLARWLPVFSPTWIVTVLLMTVISYPVRALLAQRRRRDQAPLARELRLLAALGALAGGALALTVIGLVHAGRSSEPSPAAKVPDLHDVLRFAGEMTMWSVAGAGLMSLTALWGIVGVTWARRDPGQSAARIALFAGLAAIVGVTGLSLLRYGAAIAASGFVTDSEWKMPEQFYASIVDAGDPLMVGRWALIALAVITAAAVLASARRERGPAPPRSPIAAAGLFVLGLAAFALTRDVDHDARHPLPFLDGAPGSSVDDGVDAALPVARSCGPALRDQPSMGLGPLGDLLVNRRNVEGLAELEKELDATRQIWTQVQPGKRFPGRVAAAIPRDTPIAKVAPLFAAARAAGYDDIDILEALPPRTYTTRTLGEITYRPRPCYAPTKAAVELPRQGTWGEFARSLPAP